MKRSWNHTNQSFDVLDSMTWPSESPYETENLAPHAASGSGPRSIHPLVLPMSFETSRNSNSPQSSSRQRRSSPAPAHSQAMQAPGPIELPKSAERPLLPAISRKIKACTACRKLKMKCDMEGDQPPCTRCERRRLPCVLNKSLQSLLDTSSQTQAMQNDILNLFATLAEVCNHNNLKPPKPLQIRQPSRAKIHTGHQQDDGYIEENDSCVASRPMSPSDMEAPINGFLEESEKVGTASSQMAAGSPYGSTYSKKGTAEPDLISSGIISSETADILVRRYLDRLDHYLYGIGSVYTDLKSLRTSPILLAAVCTISALHDEERQKGYEACNDEFQRLVSKSLFEKRGLEYLRALCIGSYWLSDVSRILNSDALRRAADVRLSKYFYQVTAATGLNQQTVGDLSMTAKVDRVRLWYLLYICDQHLSILYNRDPIVHGNQDLVLGWETFLESNNTGDPDVRICSQVALLQIMSQIRTCGSSEIAEPVPKALTTAFSDYKRQIDRWYFRFSPMFKPNPQIGDFPHKGLTLHYHFAKVYLGHHVFRGLGMSNGQIPSYFLATALMAHSASHSIFELLLEDSILKESLVGVPFYFHVMISFAGQFMLSCSPYSGQLSIEAKDDKELMGRAISMFKSIACLMAHPLQRMTAALERRLHECRAILEMERGPASLNRAINGDTQPEAFRPPNDHAQSQHWGTLQGNGNNNMECGQERGDGGSKAPIDHRVGSSHAFPPAIGRPGVNSNSISTYMTGSSPNVANRLQSEPGTFGMAPLSQTYVMSSDAVYQDFAGFDFPSFQMNYATGSS